MRQLIFVIAVVGWLVVVSPVAQACSCAGAAAPCEAYGTASAVFVGTATRVSQRERPKPEDAEDWFFERVVKFSVEHSYLGVDGTEVEVLTGRGGGDCGYQFEIGQRYLVYAHNYQNRLITTICTRTKSFASANEDLAFLGNLASAERGATIYGKVFRTQASKVETAPLPSDVAVLIEGGNVRREVRPDAEGRYRVSGLTPGKFKVTLKIPVTLTTHRPEREITVADRGCATLDYYVADNGRVSGQVRDAVGKPIARIYVSLIKPGTSDPRKNNVTAERTDEEGRFSMAGVAAGQYLIAVNYYQFPDPKDSTGAYPAVFYPGVVDEPNAEVVTLGVGEKLTGLDIRVPLRRPASVLSGQVVWADGSPVANASLSLTDVTETAPALSYGLETDAQGRFTIDGYIGQKLIIEARSNRPYVQVPNRHEPMERTEKVRITLSRPQEKVKVVITKLR